MKAPTLDKRTLRRLAVSGDLDPRTIAGYLEGRRLWPRNREAVELALDRSGLGDLIRRERPTDDHAR